VKPFRLAVLVLVLFAFALTACHKQSAVVTFCLGQDGTSQDCGIACQVTKDQKSCAKWADQTRAICAKVSKADCQEICEKDQNPTACDLVKTMK
jgi:hypothetical protein